MQETASVQHFVPDETDRFGDAEPYVLYVGAVRPHKNLGVLIQALAQVPGAYAEGRRP